MGEWKKDESEKNNQDRERKGERTKEDVRKGDREREIEKGR